MEIDEFGQVKYTISPRVRAEMIARTEHARAVNTGTLQSYANYGVEMVEIITARDDLVCEICEEYDEENPHRLSDAQDLLPAHPNCYMKDTQVFTVDGWKYFNDLTDKDYVLSMNPETEETEFIKPSYLIEYKAYELIHVYNDEIDFCVTKDHDCFVYVDGKPSFIKTKNLSDGCCFKTEDKLIDYKDCTVETIKYDDYVYCVELPKWHTLWVMRDGKTSWNGNCRCAYAPYVPELPSAEELGLVDNPIVVDLTESF